jgi:hypothetical protein
LARINSRAQGLFCRFGCHFYLNYTAYVQGPRTVPSRSWESHGTTLPLCRAVLWVLVSCGIKPWTRLFPRGTVTARVTCVRTFVEVKEKSAKSRIFDNREMSSYQQTLQWTYPRLTIRCLLWLGSQEVIIYFCIFKKNYIFLFFYFKLIFF